MTRNSFRVVCIWLLLAHFATAAAAFQRMGLIVGSNVTLSPGSSGTLNARCMDEHAGPPTPSSNFTQVMNTQDPRAITVNVGGRSYSLQEALDRRMVKITGRSGRPTAFGRSYPIDGVRIENLTNENMHISVNSAAVLGGSHHQPLDIHVSDLLKRGSDQEYLWRQMESREAQAHQARIDQKKRETLEEARQVARILSADPDRQQSLVSSVASELDSAPTRPWSQTEGAASARTEIQEFQQTARFLGVDTRTDGVPDQSTVSLIATRGGSTVDDTLPKLQEELRSVERKLNLAGFRAPLGGSYNTDTKVALGRFQSTQDISSGVVDDATKHALDAAEGAALNYLRAAGPYIFQSSDVVRELSDLNRNFLGTAVPLLGSEQKREIAKRLEPVFDPVRGAFQELALQAPISNNPLKWRETIQAFQSSRGLTQTGIVDAATRTEIESLSSTVRDNRTLNVPPEEGWRLSGWNRGRLSFPNSMLPDDVSKVSFFAADIEIAHLIKRSFNEALGEQVITTLPATDDEVVIAVVDTRGYGLNAKVRGVLETHKLGVSLAASNGLAVYSPFFDQATGTMIMQRSSPNGTVLDTVKPMKPSGWDRVLKLLKLSEPNAAQVKRAERMIRKDLSGKDVLLVQDHEAAVDLDYESLSRVPVFRSAVPGRSSDEIVRDLSDALGVQANPRNTIVFSGLPQNAAEHGHLARTPDFRGGWDRTWKSPSKRLHQALEASGLKIAKRTAQPQRALKKALTTKENVVVIVAHGEGHTIYLPGKKGVHGVSITDIESVQAGIAKNKPTVLLISCRAGSVQPDVESFSQGLVRAGARLVIAPTADISVRESDIMIRRVLEKARKRSLIEAILEFYGEIKSSEGVQRLRMYVELLTRVKEAGS